MGLLLIERSLIKAWLDANNGILSIRGLLLTTILGCVGVGGGGWFGIAWLLRYLAVKIGCIPERDMKLVKTGCETQIFDKAILKDYYFSVVNIRDQDNMGGWIQSLGILR